MRERAHVHVCVQTRGGTLSFHLYTTQLKDFRRAPRPSDCGAHRHISIATEGQQEGFAVVCLPDKHVIAYSCCQQRAGGVPRQPLHLRRQPNTARVQWYCFWHRFMHQGAAAKG